MQEAPVDKEKLIEKVGRLEEELLRLSGRYKMPRNNLISNIGMGRPDATHTKGSSRRANYPTQSVYPLRHPSKVKIDSRADRDFVDGRGVGLKKLKATYQIAKRVRRLRRAIARSLGR